MRSILGRLKLGTIVTITFSAKNSYSAAGKSPGTKDMGAFNRLRALTSV